ncbi:hypothetical protein BDV18DRAFT_138383 [Aspergillus unguis]
MRHHHDLEPIHSKLLAHGSFWAWTFFENVVFTSFIFVSSSRHQMRSAIRDSSAKVRTKCR